MEFKIIEAKQGEGIIYIINSEITTSDGKVHKAPVSYFRYTTEEELTQKLEGFAQLYEDGQVVGYNYTEEGELIEGAGQVFDETFAEYGNISALPDITDLKTITF